MIGSLSKIREVMHMLISPSSYQEFCKKTFKLDIKTHWNSTYLVLASCAGYNDTLTTYANYKLGEGSIIAYDWNITYQ